MLQLRPATQFDGIVERIVSSDAVLDAMRHMGELKRTASQAPPDEALERLEPLVANFGSDPLAAYLALFALSAVESHKADAVLVDALTHGDPGLAEHAAWALSRRRPIPSAMPRLIELSREGGFSQMMAELTLEAWLRENPDLIWLGGRDVPQRIWLMTRPKPRPVMKSRPGGLRITQVLMQGRVDAALSAPGSGDGGGLITLQVGLTRELAQHTAVSDALLITRLVEDGSGIFDRPSQEIAPGGSIARIPFGGPELLSQSDMWAHRAELEREMTDLFVSEGHFDALHLRFADVGTFVGARLAEEFDIPVFFTLAPDPHAVIATAERAGHLTRENFAVVDRSEHYMFRMWLVEWMLDRSERLALLPRADQRRQFMELLGVDVEDHADRFVVIPEGVDTDLATDARRAVLEAEQSDLPAVLAPLRDLIAGLPERRRELPLILSVGRLNRIKGMDRVVAAWAGDDQIREAYNLLIVGGDLENPSEEERACLHMIHEAVGEQSTGLLMMGGRTHTEVATLMSVAAEGVGGVAGPRGIYVSGSEKEEFGLAIVEALAAGLPVVAPSTGGPASYVDHGFTGYLSDTTDVDRIRDGIRWAGAVRLSEVRADAARRMVRTTYSLARMADELVEFYGGTQAKQSSVS